MGTGQVDFLFRFDWFGTGVRIPEASGPKRVSGGTQGRINAKQSSLQTGFIMSQSPRSKPSRSEPSLPTNPMGKPVDLFVCSMAQ